MRERLIVAVVGVAVLVILAFALFAAYTVSSVVEAEARTQLDRSSAVDAALLRLVVVGVLLTAVATVAAYVIAGRMTLPFRELAEAADEFDRGRFDAEVPHHSIPEAAQIGAGMREAQREMSGLLSREREFAVNASHRLKTPLTALRLELEDLTLWEQTHPDVAAQLALGLGELDRLTASVDTLLELVRSQRLEGLEEIDLCALIADTARRWRPRVEAAGRKLVALTPGQIGVRLPPGPISQVLDALVVRALRQGAGHISLTVAALDTHVRVQVSDQGEGGVEGDVLSREPLEVGGRRDDISFAEAGKIAEAFGGYLRIEPDPPTTLTLMLARSRPLDGGGG